MEAPNRFSSNEQGSAEGRFRERAVGHELGFSKTSQLTSIVFVVDDDASLRKSLEFLIRSAGWQPKTFASAEEFLECPRATVPHCLVLDVSLPGLSGLDLQKRVALERPHMPIIFIADHSDVNTTVKAMKAGAVEFFLKPFRVGALLSSIHEALERSSVALGYEAEMRVLRDRYTSLSRREREVMALVASGSRNKQVAGELGISEVTVKCHRGQVMQKMIADSLPDLVRMAAKLGVAAAQDRPWLRPRWPQRPRGGCCGTENGL